MSGGASKALRWTPRILGICMAAFLSAFALDALSEGNSPGETAVALTMHLVPSLIVVAALLLAWRREVVGGLLFVALGVLYIATAWGRFPLITYLVISGPLLLVGALFLWSWAVGSRRSD